MKIKSPPKVLELFKEGVQFEKSTKTVEITVRGKKQAFEIRPVDYFKSAIATAKRARAFASLGGVGGRDVDYSENAGVVELEIVAEHTLEFKDIDDAAAIDFGARDMHDFVAKCLGVDGVRELFSHIENFSIETTEAHETEVDDLAEEIKN